MGLAGWWYGSISVVLAVWMTVASWRLYRTRSVPDARRVFLSSLAYLPILMIAMVVDRGPISPRAWSDGGRELAVEIDAQGARLVLPSPESTPDREEKPSP
jgi:hypothetical protein